MTRFDRRLLSCWLGLLVSCAPTGETRRPEPAPPPSAERAAPAVSPAPEPPAPRPALPSPSPEASALAKKLVARWCKRGFSLPESAPGEPPAWLPSCDTVKTEISEQSSGALRVELINLSGPSSDVRYLALRHEDTLAVAELAHAWGSGVGGFSYEITVEKVELRDVAGDATPEWIGEVVTQWHDSDMGFCKVTGELERKLVLCTLESGAFKCASTPLVKSRYGDFTPDTASDCKKFTEANEGYAAKATVSRDTVEIVALGAAELPRPYSKAKKIPRSGKIKIANLLSTSPAEMVPAADL